MIHYNYLMQQFHLLYDGDEAMVDYEAQFFFPLLKTPQVLKRLNAMWYLICEKLHWPFQALENGNTKQAPAPVASDQSDDDDDEDLETVMDWNVAPEEEWWDTFYEESEFP
jgi:hypothetical protein